jgi:thiol-disulfide isomerase/thioredoxin
MHRSYGAKLKGIGRAWVALAVASGLGAVASPALAEALTGRWQASAEVGGAKVPFRLDLVRKGGAVEAVFFDGRRPINRSSVGDYHDGRLHLVFASYAATLDANVRDGQLDGAYVVGGRSIPVHAVRGGQPAPLRAGPDIHGEWIVPYKSRKGEAAWRLIVRQAGGVTEASILRIDGDTGTLSGTWADGAFRLSHFAGERPALLEAAPQPDGSLKLTLTDNSGRLELEALRPAAAARRGLAPTDPTRHTGVANAAEPFRFAFRDLSGRVVENTDRRFRGKVVLVNVMGSWCPNCHDEAPFLQALYRKYGKAGLEIVALDFEQPDQLADPQRLRAFVREYGITYTVLLVGEPKEAAAKLPQASNLNAWPTTFFLGRDGRVRTVHVGFTSRGSGARDAETRAAYQRDVERLLAESGRAPKARAAAE